MNCRECDSDKLIAAITLTFELPMALRSGSVKIGGSKITHLDFKEAWDKQRPLRGPILCSECGTEHYYVVGNPDGLRVGRVHEQRKLHEQRKQDHG